MSGIRRPAADPFVAFKRHVRAETVPGQGAAFVLSDQGVTVLRGSGVENLVPLLDGSRTLTQLLKDASAMMPVAEAGRAVRRLAEANLVGYRHATEPCGADARLARAYWDRAGLDGGAAAERVLRTPVAVVPVGDVDLGAVFDACRACGLDPVAADVEAPVALVVCEDYLAPEVGAVGARLRAKGKPWLLAAPFGADPWTGPFFDAEPAGPCWSCLAHRLAQHRRNELPLQQALGLDAPLPRPAPTLGSVRALGLHSAVLEMQKWLAGLRLPEQRSVRVLDSLTLRTVHHPVFRRPQCPQCGDPTMVSDRARRPIALAPTPKARGAGSNDRALSAEEMLERHRHLVGRVAGIVTELRPLSGLPQGLHAYDSGHNLALVGRSLEGVRQVLRARSGGKGVTAVEAKASALGEAAERYSAARQGDELTFVDSLDGLGTAAVHPNAYQLYSERQYLQRQRWNATNVPFHHVSEPFDTALPTEWTPVWSLNRNAQLLLPTSTLYFDNAPGGSPDGLWADSNGNAAGSSIEDAIVQGFLELVERDAVAIWWYNRLRRPALDLDSFDEPWLARMREALERAGRQVWALDLTTDLGVPVVAVVCRTAAAGGATDHVLGFGAHFDPRLALRRALTEAAQLLTSAATGLSEQDQPQLVADPGLVARTPRCWVRPVSSVDLLDDVEFIRELVAAHGMELLVLDQTRPDVAIPVVKVLVPGLRPFYARFAPGRLFDVPVVLGQRTRPLAYRDLNRVPLPV
ncbi:TOMM precursor leader peptide-binding protein [Streptomyces sp. NPDC006879]|uniref:TOMM precursor leader peptide-binding protein n=1 Tax=Streptomyces sp. NPDC006879 TaxID=3364767 RepID=UPI00367CE782